MKVSSSVAFAAIFLCASNAQSCEITRLLSGESQIVQVSNYLDGSIYKTYLSRNDQRDPAGTLNNWIKFELIPQRWGFDLELPSGKRFAQVNKANGKWIVSANPGYMDACANHYVTLRKGAAGHVEVYDGLQRIGDMARFPSGELF